MTGIGPKDEHQGEDAAGSCERLQHYEGGYMETGSLWEFLDVSENAGEPEGNKKGGRVGGLALHKQT